MQVKVLMQKRQATSPPRLSSSMTQIYMRIEWIQGE